LLLLLCFKECLLDFTANADQPFFRMSGAVPKIVCLCLKFARSFFGCPQFGGKTVGKIHGAVAVCLCQIRRLLRVRVRAWWRKPLPAPLPQKAAVAGTRRRSTVRCSFQAAGRCGSARSPRSRSSARTPMICTERRWASSPRTGPTPCRGLCLSKGLRTRPPYSAVPRTLGHRSRSADMGPCSPGSKRAPTDWKGASQRGGSASQEAPMDSWSEQRMGG
jgi:hypothetical protein